MEWYFESYHIRDWLFLRICSIKQGRIVLVGTIYKLALLRGVSRNDLRSLAGIIDDASRHGTRASLAMIWIGEIETECEVERPRKGTRLLFSISDGANVA